MTLTTKLKSIFGPLIILAITGAITISAQTPTVADNASRSGPKETEDTKPSILASETRVLPAKNDPQPVDKSGDSSVTTPADPSGPPDQSTPNDGWQFMVAPYFWLSGIHGTTGLPNRTIVVSEPFRDVFDSLQFALMGAFEARKNKFSILTNLEYVSLKDEKATPGPLFSSVEARIKMFIFNPAVGYRFYESSDNTATLDVEGGVRVWRISTDFTFAPGILPGTEVQASRSWADAVVGLSGRKALSEKVFLLGKFDLGGGGSKFTYRIFGGGGYNLTPRIPLVFGYRVLDVDYNRDNFVYDMNQRGPIFGVGFKF